MTGKARMDETSPSTLPDDTDCVSHMELKDMMRAMTDAFNKYQTTTTATFQRIHTSVDGLAAWLDVVEAHFPHHTPPPIVPTASGDEDIPPNDTPMPTMQQGPMIRARARELNYQVNSFLAVHKPSSMNGILLNSCDTFLILRNLGHEPNWRESKHDKKASVDDQIGPYQFGPPGRGNFGRP
jgi:hypothetical protein